MQKLEHIGSINRSLAPEYIKYKEIEIILRSASRAAVDGEIWVEVAVNSQFASQAASDSCLQSKPSSRKGPVAPLLSVKARLSANYWFEKYFIFSFKIHLHKKVKKGVVLSLVLKVSVFVTRKWPTRPEIVSGIVTGDTQVRAIGQFFLCPRSLNKSSRGLFPSFSFLKWRI